MVLHQNLSYNFIVLNVQEGLNRPEYFLIFSLYLMLTFCIFILFLFIDLYKVFDTLCSFN